MAAVVRTHTDQVRGAEYGPGASACAFTTKQRQPQTNPALDR